MSIEKVDFDSIEEEDIQELINAQVTEGLRLEFKLVQYGNSDSAKKELLKDVTAIANSHGGHLILGIREGEGAATEIVGLDIDIDAEITRMEQIIRDATEPPVSGLRMRGITVTNNNKIILIRIPKSWYPPHRVTYQGTKRFFTRHSAGVHEPSVEELRAMFNQTTSAIQMARVFRDKRIELVADGEGSRPLIGEGRLFIHIVPVAAFSGAVQLDMERVHEINQKFWPIASDYSSPGYNLHGFINGRGGDLNHGYVHFLEMGF